ncbi:hypothetical protein FJZ36_18625 [Candidatus Poribacteria bacterium]|nr:hypothetical protein [Candidatus Poribacteria bacterium]
MTIPIIRADETTVPPAWALWQRRLFDIMDEAGLAFVERYTREDGTLIWRDDWPGMDGSDDAYETFYTFPLHFALGGADIYRELGQRLWDAVTWQFTEYGQVHREFDAYYDWMHHGESSLYFYFLPLAEPYDLRNRQRTARFADFYTGDDPDAPNYDRERRLIRSPINGSRGPRLEMTFEDWSTHRWVLSNPIFGLPFEDIPGVPGPSADWNDDETFRRILDAMNARMARGDVPLNLMATSLVAHAYVMTGEGRYRDWVLDYLDAWVDRARRNGGLLPDNVGLSGEIGECMDGKWWGGYYGWRWPHGGSVLLEAAAVGSANAVLVTGDPAHLDLIRTQLDRLWTLRRKHGDGWQTPHRHTDSGWTDFRPMSPELAIHTWNLSESHEDAGRILRVQDPERMNHEFSTRGMGRAPNAAWFRYVTGHCPDYPQRALEETYRDVCRAMELIRSDREDPTTIYIQHWIPRNPVVCAVLAQLTTGAPYPIYHGGLLHARVRYYDADRRRAGLPVDVAALVESVAPSAFRLTLVNTSPQHVRTVIAQPGAFGEHEFAAARNAASGEEHRIDGSWLTVQLAPAASITLDVSTRRFARSPSFDTPWRTRADAPRIALRDPSDDSRNVIYQWETDHPLKPAEENPLDPGCS